MRKKKDKEEFLDQNQGDIKDNMESEKDISLSPRGIEAEEKKAQDYNALWDKHLRICAEFDNARKRWDRERKEVVKFSNFLLIKELIIILDELGHALESIKEHSSQDAITEGINITYNKLFGLLKKEGVQHIESLGKKFDPHLHEIVGQIEADDDQEHVVLEEVQRGYLLADKVLRTSNVIIGIKKQKSEDRSQNSEYKDEIEEKREIDEQSQEKTSNNAEEAGQNKDSDS